MVAWSRLARQSSELGFSIDEASAEASAPWFDENQPPTAIQALTNFVDAGCAERR